MFVLLLGFVTALETDVIAPNLHQEVLVWNSLDAESPLGVLFCTKISTIYLLTYHFYKRHSFTPITRLLSIVPQQTARRQDLSQ